MGPTIKTYGNLTKRRTLNSAPPIHTIRKNDAFDKLLNPDSSKSNIFQSSSDGNFSAEDTSVKPKFFTLPIKTNIVCETKMNSSRNDTFALKAKKERRGEERRENAKKLAKKKKRKKNSERKLKGLFLKQCSPEKTLPHQLAFTSTPLVAKSKIVELADNICSPIVKLADDKGHINNLTRKFKNLKVRSLKTSIYDHEITEMDISKDAQSRNKNAQEKFIILKPDSSKSIISVHESPEASMKDPNEYSLLNMSYEVNEPQNKTKDIEYEKSENIIIDFETSPFKSELNTVVDREKSIFKSTLNNFPDFKNDTFPASSTPCRNNVSKLSEKFVTEVSPFKSFSLSKNDIDPIPLNSKSTISKRSESSPFGSTDKFSLSNDDNSDSISSSYLLTSKRLDSSNPAVNNLILENSRLVNSTLGESLFRGFPLAQNISSTQKKHLETSSYGSTLNKFSLSKNDTTDSVSYSHKLTSKSLDLSNLASKNSILEKNSSIDSKKSPIEKADYQTTMDGSFELVKNISSTQKKSEPRLMVVKENSFEQISEESECSFEQDSESSFEPSPSEMSKSFMDELALEKLTGFDDDYNYDHSPTRRSRNLPLYDRTSPLDPLPENQEYFEKIEKSPADSDDSCKTPPLRIKKRLSKERSPTRRSNIARPTIIPELNKVIEESESNSCMLETEDDQLMPMENFVLPAGKKYRRSLSIIRHLDGETSLNATRGRNYECSIEQVVKLQTPTEKNETSPINILKKKISIRRSSLLKQFTPPPRRRNRIALQLPSTPRNLFASSNTSIFKESFEIKNSPRLNSINLASPQFKRMTSCIMDRKSQIPSPETSLHSEEDSSELVFLLCTPEQNEPMEFNDILPSEAYSGSTKIGEGVYGEVFFVARENRKNVLKIIPIEGDFLVNDEKQKTYSEIYSELLITRLLNQLRGNMEGFLATGFAELIQANVVRGSYPPQLISLWEEYDQVKGSDNDNPSLFGDNQLFLILELAHAGTDLESYSFSTARQALSIFKQIAFNLAVAEACLNFEHRDLHWGNILISGTTERQMTYKILDDEYKIATNGVKATVIDFTLSRITFTGEEEIPIYYDVGKEPDMFIANGDYQFDIYRHMRKDLNNEWSQYQPKTNVRWLHYVLDKMIKKVKYRRKTAKVHKDSMKTLQDIESWILDCDNSLDVGVKLAE